MTKVGTGWSNKQVYWPLREKWETRYEPNTENLRMAGGSKTSDSRFPYQYQQTLFTEHTHQLSRIFWGLFHTASIESYTQTFIISCIVLRLFNKVTVTYSTKSWSKLPEFRQCDKCLPWLYIFCTSRLNVCEWCSNSCYHLFFFNVPKICWLFNDICFSQTS